MVPQISVSYFYFTFGTFVLNPQKSQDSEFTFHSLRTISTGSVVFSFPLSSFINTKIDGEIDSLHLRLVTVSQPGQKG